MRKSVFIVISAICILAVLIGLYFLRDFIFINANSQIKYLNEVQEAVSEGYDWTLLPNWTHSQMEAFFEGWNLADLSKFKWMFTIAFTGVFCLITAVGIQLVSNQKMALLTIALFALLFLLSFLLSFINYQVARDLIGILHSPVPFLLMLCACYLNQFQFTDEK